MHLEPAGPACLHSVDSTHSNRFLQGCNDLCQLGTNIFQGFAKVADSYSYVMRVIVWQMLDLLGPLNFELASYAPIQP